MHNVPWIAIVLYFRVHIIIVANDEGAGRHRRCVASHQFTDGRLAGPFAIAGAVQLRGAIQPVILVALILDHRVHSCCAIKKYRYTAIGSSRCTAIHKSARRRFAGPFSAQSAGNNLEKVNNYSILFDYIFSSSLPLRPQAHSLARRHKWPWSPPVCR